MDGMQWMASAMHAARGQLETATHNLANVSSDGFRRIRSEVALTDRGLVVGRTPSDDQGGIRETGRSLDLALLGPGSFDVGGHATRNGAFVRDRDGFVANDRGDKLAGTGGPLRISADARFESDGTVRDGGRIVGRIPLPAGTTIRAGALEASNVNAIGETLDVLTAQRAFETAQKTLSAIDEARQKNVNDVVRLK